MPDIAASALIAGLFLAGPVCAATPGAVKLFSRQSKDDQKSAQAYPLGVNQQQPEEKKAFYDDAKRGWWWYETMPEKDESTDEDRKVLQSIAPPPSLRNYPMDQLWNMHPDEFQPLINAFLKKAVQYPTEENVQEYYVVQDIARRKAATFANVASVVWQKNPDLNLKKDFPFNTPGDHAKIRTKTREIEDKIRGSADDFALLYFYSDTCEFCKAQSDILKYFVDKYAWNIKGLEISRSPDLAQHFNVETVPFLMLIYKRSKDSLPVSVGVAALDEIEKNLYKGIRLLSGETTPENYNLYDFQRGGGFDPNLWQEKPQ
jgi:conjugal transfer pilus assembly protein TraF